VISNVNLVQDI